MFCSCGKSAELPLGSVAKRASHVYGRAAALSEYIPINAGIFYTILPYTVMKKISSRIDGNGIS